MQDSPYQTVGINGVWQNLGVDVSTKQAIQAAKQTVKKLAESGELLRLSIREELVGQELRQVAYIEEGQRFGTVARDTFIPDATVLLRVMVAQDGNVRGVLVS